VLTVFRLQNTDLFAKWKWQPVREELQEQFGGWPGTVPQKPPV